MGEQVPLYDPTNVVGDEELERIRSVLESGWLTLGEQTDQLETEFASIHDVDHGVAVDSCTSALYTVLKATGIGDGDRVVVPAITFSATAAVVRQLGGTVHVCDVNENGNMDPGTLADILATTDVEAVIPVHLYGLPCEMERICSLADDHDAAVIEDAAHAPGATVGDRPAGSFGDAGCFSFYATKNLTAGEGGMVVTDDPEIARTVRKLRNHHQTTTPQDKTVEWDYNVDGLGFNYRMSEIQATMVRGQLERFPEMIASRQAVADRYREALSSIDGLEWAGDDTGKEHVFHLFVVRVGDDYPLDRNRLYEHLADRDIRAGVHYRPIQKLDYYRDVAGEAPLSEELFERILSVPMYPDMTEPDQTRVIDTLRNPLA